MLQLQVYKIMCEWLIFTPTYHFGSYKYRFKLVCGIIILYKYKNVLKMNKK